MKTKTEPNTKKEKYLCRGNHWEPREDICVKNRNNSDEKLFDSVSPSWKRAGKVFWESFTENVMPMHVCKNFSCLQGNWYGKAISGFGRSRCRVAEGWNHVRWTGNDHCFLFSDTIRCNTGTGDDGCRSRQHPNLDGLYATC